VSGAGKTTLMDVLAGRKTGGYIEGDIRISGYPKKQETFARISGYCEQNDIHSPNVTVKESLVYSAWLRLPKDVDKRTRMVKSCIYVLFFLLQCCPSSSRGIVLIFVFLAGPLTENLRHDKLMLLPACSFFF
jgi:ABC-type sugar transport system ATPase subunit